MAVVVEASDKFKVRSGSVVRSTLFNDATVFM